MKRGGSVSFLTIFTCRSRVIGLDMTENRIFTLCHMITWVVFLRMFWNFISSLPVKRGRSLSFLTIFTFAVPEFIGLDMTENRIFTLCRMITWVLFLRMFWNFISSLPVKRGGSLSFLVGTISNVLVMEIGWTDMGSGGYILVSCAHSNTSFICRTNCNKTEVADQIRTKLKCPAMNPIQLITCIYSGVCIVIVLFTEQ